MSRKTSNHGLIQLELNDNANFPQLLNDTFATIDKGIAPFYVATLNSSNVYKVTTGLSLTALQDGFSVRVAIPSAINGATSLIVDNAQQVAIKKVNGSTATNLKSNGVYSLTYYNGNFILASGGVDSDKVTASEADVLTGKIYIGNDEEIHTGSMPNNGQLNASIGINGVYNIPKGYIEGGKVSQSIPIQGGSTTTPGTSDKTIVAANRYITGDIKVKGDSNLIADNIISGKSIFGVTGNATIQSLGGLNKIKGTLGLGQSVNFGFTATKVTLYGQNPSNSNGKTIAIIDFEVGTMFYDNNNTGSDNREVAHLVLIGSSASYAGATITQTGISISSETNKTQSPYYMWRTDWNYIAIG